MTPHTWYRHAQGHLWTTWCANQWPYRYTIQQQDEKYALTLSELAPARSKELWQLVMTIDGFVSEQAARNHADRQLQEQGA